MQLAFRYQTLYAAAYCYSKMRHLPWLYGICRQIALVSRW